MPWPGHFNELLIISDIKQDHKTDHKNIFDGTELTGNTNDTFLLFNIVESIATSFDMLAGIVLPTGISDGSATW